MQHYVSKFIVKRWAWDNGHVRLHCVEHGEQIVLRRSPINTFSWPDLYNLNAHDSGKSLTRFLEQNAYNPLEIKMAKLINHLEKRKQSGFCRLENPTCHKLILAFIRLHFIRHPEYLKEMLIRYQPSLAEYRLTPEDYSQFGIHMESSDDAIKFLIANAIITTDSLKSFANATFLYFRVQPDCKERFLLGDRLYYSHMLEGYTKVYREGLMFFPVSPTSCIILTNLPKTLEGILKSGDKKIVRTLNTDTLYNSRYAIAEPCPSLRYWIQKHFTPSHELSNCRSMFVPRHLILPSQ